MLASRATKSKQRVRNAVYPRNKAWFTDIHGNVKFFDPDSSTIRSTKVKLGKRVGDKAVKF